MQQAEDLCNYVFYPLRGEGSRLPARSTMEMPGWACLALAFAWFLNIAFPGDTPWIHDEPMLLLKAFDHNTQGRLALEGLRSVSTGITYGPVAIWFYQGLLLLSTNPVHLVLLKAVLSASTVTMALVFLSIHLRLSPWPILLCLLSPYFYLSHRVLWDNVLLVPLSLLGVCFALLFHERQKASHWGLGLLIAILMVHLHLMSTILIVPVGVVLICLHVKWFLNRPIWGIVSLLALAGSLLHYLSLSGKGTAFPWVMDQRSFTALAWNTWGPSLFSFLGFGPYFLPGVLDVGLILPGPLVNCLVVVSTTVILPFIVGFGGCLWETRRALNRGTWSAGEFLSVCAILVVLLDWYLFYFTGLGHHPHYDYGVWFAFFYLLWRGWQWLLRWLGTLAGTLLGLQIGATGILLWALVVFIHLSGGSRGIHYGPTLSNQISAVATVLKYSPQSPIRNAVEHYELFPMAFNGLIRLLGDPERGGERPLRSITLLQDKDPRWFWIQVVIEPRSWLAGGRKAVEDGAIR